MTDDPTYLTDEEWFAFQRIPDQGYSHRSWVDARIDEHVKAARPIVPKDLHRDEWMAQRIDRALDAIRHAEYAGLETALDLIAFAEDVLERYGRPEPGSDEKVIDVRFTFKEDEPEPDGYRHLDLVKMERTRCDLDESQQLGVGEEWSQSDRYSIGISMDLIGVVSDGKTADYSETPPRTY